MASVTPASIQPGTTTTADDTLQRKSRDAGVVSGGHLVAKALKNEGVDTIFTLCGGHIIDIYDGCADEGIKVVDVRHEQVAAHLADGYARQTGKLGCVVTTAGPGCTNAVTGIATAFRSESPVLHIGGQGALTQHKMGSLQDLPHVDLMTPITKFAATVPSTERVADMISMAARGERSTAHRDLCIWRFRAMCSIAEVDVAKSVSTRSRAGTAPRPVRWGIRATSRSSADILVNSERPAILYGQQVYWTARGHEEAIALLPRPGYPGLFQWREPPGSCRPAIRIISTAPAVRPSPRRMRVLIVGTPFRFPHGLRQAHQQGSEARRSRSTWTIEPSVRIADIDLGLVGDPDAILGAVRSPPPGGRIKNEKRQLRRQQWLKESHRRRKSCRDREAHAAVQIQQRADSSVPRGVGVERIPRGQYRLHRRRRRCGNDLGASGSPARPRTVDGSRRVGFTRRGDGVRDRRGARASVQGNPMLLRRRFVRA